ncbi:MAG: sensor histidine kinase, partial [Saprospiraceae bacterium]
KNIPRFYQKLSDAYFGLNQYKEALLWSNKSNEANQELLKQQQNKEVMKLQVQYNVQQKQAENEVLILQNKNQNIFIALLVAIFIVILFLLFNSFKKNQAKQIEQIRLKIAADLHDDVGSNLNSINRLAKGLKIPENLNEINQGIDLLVAKSNNAIQNVVDVIWTLDNEETELGFLLDKMESYLDQIKLSNKNIQIKFTRENLNESKSLSMDVKHHLLMIFKEAVNNIQKHTNSNLIEIKVKNNSKFNLSFFNTYSSKKENPHSTGRGILNIKKRASELNGKVEIIETPSSYFLQIELDSLALKSNKNNHKSKGKLINF